MTVVLGERTRCCGSDVSEDEWGFNLFGYSNEIRIVPSLNSRGRKSGSMVEGTVGNEEWSSGMRSK